MSIKRRQFLQFAGSAFGTIAISQLDIIRQSDRYAQVLAQPTSRKLALLVGIDQYPTSQRFLSLRGCGNDVELQKQLLIHRFGFKTKDIKILTDKQATRANILEAFEEHLIKQAKPGDVVVFHFSGHGSRVIDPNPIEPKNTLNSTFVPVDDSAAVTSGNVDDIMGRSLFLLMSSLQTDNFTAVLDSCHSGGGTRGNIRIRAARGGLELDIKPSDKEKIPVDTPIQFQITNEENSSLYVNVLVIDAQGQMSVIFPNNWVVGKEDMRVRSKETRLVPNPDEDQFVLRTQQPKGTTEVLVLASRTPMDQALKALRNIAGRGKKQPDSRTLSLSDENDSVNVIDAILSDFDSGTRSSRPGGIVSEQRIRTSDTNQLAALSITFEVT